MRNDAWKVRSAGRKPSIERDKMMLAAGRPSTRALYLQVRDALVERIASGEWRSGSAIPNEVDLAREIGVSSGTVRKALQLLDAQKLITRRPGRGTFVNDPASGELACRLLRLRSTNGESVSGEVTSQAISEGAPDELECARLRLCAGDSVYRIRRVRQHKGRKFMVADVTLPSALYPRLAGKSDIPVRIGALAPWNGMLLGTAQERISICIPPADVGDLLGVAPGAPAMLLDCVLFLLGTQRPAAWRMGYVHLPDGYYLAECK
jgi:GntR family transcriptional regulator